MTTLTIRADLGASIARACTVAGVRAPTSYEGGLGTLPCVLTWVPDLTPSEQATVDSIVQLSIGSVLVTPAERTAIDPDIVLLRAYFLNASPTNAQSVAAIKSIIRMLRAILRDP